MGGRLRTGKGIVGSGRVALPLEAVCPNARRCVVLIISGRQAVASAERLVIVLHFGVPRSRDGRPTRR
jgi:hypothetical protein